MDKMTKFLRCWFFPGIEHQDFRKHDDHDQWVEFITLHAPGQDPDAPEMELVKQAWKTAKNYHSLGSWSSLMTAFTTGYDLCDTGLKKQDAIQRFETILREMGV